MINLFNKNKIKSLEYAKVEDWLPDIEPIRLSVPDWWKDGELWIGGKLRVNNYTSNKGMKACVPFLESMLNGYTIKLSTDCYVESNPFGQKNINWMSQLTPVELRSKSPGVPVPHGCDSQEFAWILPYYIKTPKGYSMIITNPFNRSDLPFSTLTGIVDADVCMYPGKYPFYLKTGFTGLIKAGTPIAQLILFKRDDWKIVENNEIKKEGTINQNRSSAVISGYYKKNIHKVKKFE